MPFTTKIPELCQSSYWLCMNLLLVSPDRAIVEETEIPTINYLESLGKHGVFFFTSKVKVTLNSF